MLSRAGDGRGGKKLIYAEFALVHIDKYKVRPPGGRIEQSKRSESDFGVKAHGSMIDNLKKGTSY